MWHLCVEQLNRELLMELREMSRALYPMKDDHRTSYDDSLHRIIISSND
jgi:hypothetical protein